MPTARREGGVPPSGDPGPLKWPLDDEELPDGVLSAWAIPDPAVSAAPTPRVSAPAPAKQVTRDDIAAAGGALQLDEHLRHWRGLYFDDDSFSILTLVTRLAASPSPAH